MKSYILILVENIFFLKNVLCIYIFLFSYIKLDNKFVKIYEL